MSLYNYGNCLLGLGRLDEAETALSEAHAVATEVFGAEHVNVRGIAGALANVYDAQGRADEARALRTGP